MSVPRIPLRFRGLSWVSNGNPRARALVPALALVLTLAACREPANQGALVVPTVESARDRAPAAPAEAPTSVPAEAPTLVPAPTARPTGAALASSLALQPTSFSAERAYAELEQLALRGSRVAGSPAQRDVATYLEGRYRAAGLQVERQPFTFTAFDDRGASLQLIAPEPATLRALTLAYSPGGDVEAELVEVGLARPGDFDPAAVAGKIALAQRGEIRFGEKVANLAAAGARAVLIYNNVARNFQGNLGSPARVPTASISQYDGQRLLRLLESGPVAVRLAVDASVGERSGDNIIATKPGGPRTVVVGGHYDSVSAGLGANDNGSGTVTALEVARVAATRVYPFTVRFIAFEAEEVGLLGSARYVAQLDPAARDATIAMINLDMVGVGDQLSFGGDPSLIALARRSAGDLGIASSELRGGLGSASDYASFEGAAIPSLFLYRNEDSRYHTADDRMEYVVPDNLGTAGHVVLDLLDQLAVQASAGSALQ